MLPRLPHTDQRAAGEPVISSTQPTHGNAEDSFDAAPDAHGDLLSRSSASPNDVSVFRFLQERDGIYRREEVDQEIKDAFRERQRRRKERHIAQLVLGTGLGCEAEGTLHEGHYNPRKVLAPLKSSDKHMWDTISLHFNTHTSLQHPDVVEQDFQDGDCVAVSTAACPPQDLGALPSEHVYTGQRTPLDTVSHGTASSASMSSVAEQVGETKNYGSSAQKIMSQFRCTYREVHAILHVRVEMEENLNTAERELDLLCEPYTFKEVLSTLSMALLAAERGDLTERVALPMYVSVPPSTDPNERQRQRIAEQEDPFTLIGAEEVMRFVRDKVLPMAYEVMPSAHTIQWMVQYTVTFLHSIAAQTHEEAEIRVELLSRCVRLLGKVEQFSSVLLSLASKAEEYDAFDALRKSAEGHLGKLLNDVESTLDTILRCKFPARRERLQLVERGIRRKLQRALLFLNELDYNWTPNVDFHRLWKLRFLSYAFYRIHFGISPRFLSCSMGFIDGDLLTMVSDTRITGKHMGVLPNQPQVPVFHQVQYERLQGELDFQQIGMAVKGNASLMAGLQLCMGSRFLLQECTPAFDAVWGFNMDEAVDTVSRKEVEGALQRISSRMNQRYSSQVRPPRSTTFLTQGGNDWAELRRDDSE